MRKFLTIFLSSCFVSITLLTEQSESAQKILKLGFISYPPGFIVNPNTKEKSGIFNDILIEIAKKNNYKLQYKEEVTWATMITSLENDRVDIIANPVWATKERRIKATFSKPVYFSPIGIYVRSDDFRFDKNRKKINDSSIKIAAVDGEINNFIGKTDFPKANLQPFPNNIDVAQLFLEIESKRKDVTFAEPMFAYDYMQKNPGKIKNIATKSPIRNYPNSFMIKKGNKLLESELNKTISVLLKNGVIDKIIKKYEPFKGAVISASDPMGIERQ